MRRDATLLSQWSPKDGRRSCIAPTFFFGELKSRYMQKRTKLKRKTTRPPILGDASSMTPLFWPKTVCGSGFEGIRSWCPNNGTSLALHQNSRTVIPNVSKHCYEHESNPRNHLTFIKKKFKSEESKQTRVVRIELLHMLHAWIVSWANSWRLHEGEPMLEIGYGKKLLVP